MKSIYGDLPTGWKLKTIGVLVNNKEAEIQTGPFGTMLKASAYKEVGTPVVAVKNIMDNRIVDRDDIPKIDEDDTKRLNRYKVLQGDILFGRKGGVDRRAYITEEEEGWLQGSDCIRLRILSEKIDSKFLSYVFGTMQYRKWILQNAGGTTMPSLNQDIIKRIPIPIPPLESQRKILSILGSIDDKIELNKQMNQTLDEMAMTLYKHWFVDFGPFQDGEFVKSELGLIPNKWQVKTIKEITSKFCTGLNPRKNFKLGEGTNYYVTIKNMSNNQVILNEKCDKVTDEAIKKINNRSDLRKGDLLFSGIGTIGRVYYIDEEPNNWNISESIFTLRNNDTVSDFFLYLTLLSPELQSYAHYSASGSVQKGVRKKDLESYKVRVPEEKVMNDFTNKVSVLLKQIKNNEKENQQLVYIRDYLIPKLLSGEVDLFKVEETVEKVMQ